MLFKDKNLPLSSVDKVWVICIKKGCNELVLNIYIKGNINAIVHIPK